MPVTEILFSANYLPPPQASSSCSFSPQAVRRDLVLVCLGFCPPDEEHLRALTTALRLTSAVVSAQDRVQELLAAHSVTSLPWKSSSAEQLMREGIRASNELNDFCEAARCFSALLAQCSTSASSVASNFTFTQQQKSEQYEQDQLERDALFNMASLLHMQGFVSLALPLLHRLLQRGGRDMTSHAFLWSLAQGCCVISEQRNEQEQEGGAVGEEEGERIFLRRQVEEVYRSLACGGDVMARHKYRTLTGHDVLPREDGGGAQGKDTRIRQGAGGVKHAGKGDPDYAALIFDHMAPEFERRLVKDLHYDCPWRMKQLLDDVIESTSRGQEGSLPLPLPAEFGQWRVLDVGCGSGLIGRLFAVLAGLPPQNTAALLSPSSEDKEQQQDMVKVQDHEPEHQQQEERREGCLSDFATGPCLLGVDISEKMARLAFSNGGYSRTLCLDLDAVLHKFFNGEEGDNGDALQQLDLLVAADTFLYVGPLEETFSLARRALKPGGLLLFSTEDLDSSPMRRSVQGSCSIPGSGEKERGGGEGVELLSSARYAHSQSYIMGLADTYRFHVCRVQALVIRTEASVPLPGRIFLLQNST